MWRAAPSVPRVSPLSSPQLSPVSPLCLPSAFPTPCLHHASTLEQRASSCVPLSPTPALPSLCAPLGGDLAEGAWPICGRLAIIRIDGR
jgi:hypothetical protein